MSRDSVWSLQLMKDCGKVTTPVEFLPCTARDASPETEAKATLASNPDSNVEKESYTKTDPVTKRVETITTKVYSMISVNVEGTRPAI